MKPHVWSNPNFIAFIQWRDQTYAFFLNNSDKRGYRSIVQLYNKDILNTVNRPLGDNDFSELPGIGLVSQYIACIMKQITPIVQTARAGNNAHSFDPTNGVVFVGNVKEPDHPHVHIMCRGNPETNYVPGVPLYGPVPGELFDMRGKTINVPGNDKKVKWQPGQMDAVKKRIFDVINQYRHIERDLGIRIVTKPSEFKQLNKYHRYNDLQPCKDTSQSFDAMKLCFTVMAFGIVGVGIGIVL
jgi:hypothetical protein